MNSCLFKIIIVVAILLTGCSNKPNKNMSVSFGSNVSVSDNYAFRDNSGRLFLWDISKNNYNVFCAQPDCKHQTLAENPNSKCTAVVPKAGYLFNYAFIYSNKLYMICSGMLNEFLIYEADTDGQNKKLKYSSSISISDMVHPYFTDGLLFFVGSLFDTAAVDGWKEHYHLCSIDLSDYTYKDYGEIGIANESTLGRQSLYYYNGKIFYEHTEFVDNTVHSSIETIDVETKERTKVSEENDHLINIWQYVQGKMLYVVSDMNNSYSTVYSYDLEKGVTEILFEMKQYLSQLYKEGDRIFFFTSSTEEGIYRHGAGVYDFVNKETRQMDFEDDEYMYIDCHAGKNHLITYQKGENSQIGLMDDNDLWELAFDHAVFVKKE